MTTAELAAIARDIVPPAGASIAIALVDHQPGEKLASGSPSGQGGVTRYRAGFLVDGRVRIPVGPAFDRQRDAHRLMRLLNGDAPTSRSAAVIPAAAPLPESGGKETGEPDQLLTGPSDGVPNDAGAPRLCAGCGQPLPPGARRNRRTHDGACRVAAARGRPAAATEAATADSGGASVTVSRRSEAVPPPPATPS